MERVIGEITCAVREDQEWWIVSDQGAELRSFETFWRAHEWRRTTPLYVHYETGAGARYYREEDNAWHFRTADSGGWWKAENQKWVEDKVEEMKEKYLKNMRALGSW